MCSENSCKKQFERLIGSQSYVLDAALQHLCVKNHKNVAVVDLGVDEKRALRSLWVYKCGEKIKSGENLSLKYGAII